ncbi:MAG: class II fructose-bisphosphate aldolase [Patescibacteria group bacterium]
MSLRTTFKKYRKQSASLGAFNLSTVSQLKAAVAAACDLQTPLILELSPGEAGFFGIETLAGIRDSLVEIRAEFCSTVRIGDADLPNIYLNLDHAESINTIKRALEAGFDMVHFDGSELPFEENIAKSKSVVEIARKYNALVEGEIDQAGGHSTVKSEVGKKVMTDPKKAADFVSKTGVDILACFFGNLHGVYSKELELDFNHFQKIKMSIESACPGRSRRVFFSLHGGSGVRAGDLSKAAGQGIAKMNFNTELRQAWASSLRESLAKKKGEIVPYKVLPPVIGSVREVVEEKLRLISK